MNTTRVDLEQLEKNLDANDIHGKCAIAGLHIFGLIAELKESREVVSNLKISLNEKGSLLVENSNLREKIANLEKEVNSLSLENHGLQMEIEELQKEGSALKLAISALKMIIEKKDERIAELEKKLGYRKGIIFIKPPEAKTAGEDDSTPQSAVDQSVIEKANKILEEGK